jgi:hypothetical protein
VEPDLKVQLTFKTGLPLVLVGEMKWESPITAAQIRRERESVEGEGVEGKRVYIFAIVKNRGTRTAECLKCNKLYSWKEVHEKIQPDRFKEESPSRRWATLVSDFLKLAEQLIFSGFNLEDLNLEGLPALDEEVIFFAHQRPFHRFEWTFPDLPPIDAHNIFYHGA